MPAYTHRGRVAFHETDAAGIVHFSNYFRIAEEAETAALASLGFFSAETLQHHSFPRVQAEARYKRPLHFYEEYSVRAAVTRIGNSSLSWSFEIGGRDGLCAELTLTSVRISVETGRPLPYTAAEKDVLRRLMPECGESAAEPEK